MYSKAVTKVLNRLVDTSRVGTEVDRTKLLANLKLLLSITGYLDKEMLWEAAHLAAQEFVRQFAVVLAEMVSLRAYVTAGAPELPPKTPSNPIPQTVKAQSTYYAALGTLIAEFRPRTTAQLDPEASIRSLRRALLSCFRSLRIISAAPTTKLELFTETFAARIKEWVDRILENTDEVEIVEELGALRVLVREAEGYISPVHEKYSGVISVVEDTPATIDIQDGPYIFQTATSLGYRLAAGGPLLTWSIPASISASATGGVGPWVIAPGLADLSIRLNNTGAVLSLTPAGYANAAALAVEINLRLVAAGYSKVVASGATGRIVLALTQDAAAEGMQLKIETIGTTFPDHGFSYGWARGEHSPLYGGPTITLVSDEAIFNGAAVLNLDGTVTIANADPILDTDLVRLAYTEAGAPLAATYGISSIATAPPNQTLTLSSAAEFASAEFLGTPLTDVLSTEIVSVEILRRNKVLTNPAYLWVDACAPLGLAVATGAYATGTNITIAGTPSPPLRRGDIVTISAVDYTLQSLNPYRLSSSVGVDKTTATINSGMGAFYEALSIPSNLLQRLNPQKVREAVDKFSNHMVFASWEYFSQTFSDLFGALQTLSTTLSGAVYPTQRLPRLAVLLEKQGFGAAASALLRGDIAAFLTMSAEQAARGSDVAQEVRMLLNTYRDSGQVSS